MVALRCQASSTEYRGQDASRNLLSIKLRYGLANIIAGCDPGEGGKAVGASTEYGLQRTHGDDWVMTCSARPG